MGGEKDCGEMGVQFGRTGLSTRILCYQQWLYLVIQQVFIEHLL